MKPQHNLVLFINFLVISGIHAQSGNGCNEPLTLALRDGQFSASSVYSEQYNASQAKPGREGWRADRYADTHFLLIDFEGIYEIRALAFSKSGRYYTKQLRITYSDDGFVWSAYHSHLSDNYFGETFTETGETTRVEFDRPITTRFLAIQPIEWEVVAALNIELYGCQRVELTTNQTMTRIENDIEDDTVWVQQRSPIVISKEINVLPEATLTVEAGVSVIFEDLTARINVLGHLNAEGTAELKVLFSSNFPALSAESRWHGLIQEAGGNISLNHAIVRQAIYGIQGGADSIRIVHTDIYSCATGINALAGSSKSRTGSDVTQDDFFVYKSRVMYNYNGLSMHGRLHADHYYIGSSSFSHNFANGVESQGVSRATTILLMDSHFDNNNVYGIFGHFYSLNRMEIYGCTFINNRQRGLYIPAWDAGSLRFIWISHSRFQDNIQGGVYISCDDCLAAEWFFYGNQFDHNNIIVHYTTFRNNSNGCELLMLNNRFSNTTGRISAIGVNVDGRFILHNNTFDGAYYADTLVTIENAVTNMTSNIFETNIATRLVYFMNGLDHVIKYNSFVNNTRTRCLVQVDGSYHPMKSLDANYNYWGTSNSVDIKSLLCDFFLDSRVARIEMDKFYSDADMQILQTTSDQLTYEFREDLGAFLIGGVINTASNLSIVEDYPVIVTRSLIIEEGKTVTFSSDMNFTENRGIVVLGRLDIGSQDKEQIVLQAQVRLKSWSGIHLYSCDLNIVNTVISGYQDAIYIKTGSRINVTNTVANSNAGSFITSETMTGDLALTIKNSSFKTNYDININFYDSDLIDIEIINSASQSFSFVTISEVTNRDKVQGMNGTLSHITLIMRNCTAQSSYKTIHFLTSFSDVTTNIQESSFASRYDVIAMQASSIHASVLDNEFYECDRVLYISLTHSNVASENIPHKVTFLRNRLFSKRAGSDILVYDDRTQNKHTFEIIGNEFTQYQYRPRACIRFSGVDSFATSHAFVIDSNIFSNIQGSAVSLSGAMNDVIIVNNRFENGNCRYTCLFVAGEEVISNILNVINNTFIANNNGYSLILIDETVSETFVLRNTFENNNGTILAFTSPYISIHQNYFENAHADFNVQAIGSRRHYTSERVNASLNYWGSCDVRFINERILDQNYQDTLIDVIVRPYLCSRNYTDIDTTIDCSEIDNCSMHGDCIGPNRCSCISGWSGSFCTVPTCLNVRNCSGNGICERPDICACAEGFTGEDCSTYIYSTTTVDNTNPPTTDAYASNVSKCIANWIFICVCLELSFRLK